MSTKSITLEQCEDGYVVARAPGVVAVRQSAVEAAVAVLTAKDIFEVAEEEVPASFHFLAKSASMPTYRRGDDVTPKNVHVGMKVSALRLDLPGSQSSYFLVEEVAPFKTRIRASLRNEDDGLKIFKNTAGGSWYALKHHDGRATFTAYEDGPPSDVATTSDEIKRVLNKAVDFGLDAVIDGQREDGTSFEKRLVEPRDLDGLLLRTYDYESDDHRYFRIDRLTRVSIDDHEVREALNQEHGG